MILWSLGHPPHNMFSRISMLLVEFYVGGAEVDCWQWLDRSVRGKLGWSCYSCTLHSG
uniref:Uncharacterized protein n=1 Tax=Aegilops tauschii subsp. strangulata TaxID=200361 RepID=A0A453AZ13_AEGTS